MSFVKSAIFFLGLSFIVLGANGNVFDFIDPCHIKDNVCIVASANKALPIIAKGFPKYGIPSADPLVLDDVNGDSGKLKMRFNNVTVAGPSKCVVTKLDRIDRLHAVLVLECPIVASGLYLLGGQFFNLDIDGDGHFDIKTDNIRITVKYTMKTIQGKDDQCHYKISKFDYEFDPVAPVQFNFENLCGGDKVKAEPFNKILNNEASGKDLIRSFGKPVVVELIKKAIICVDKWFAVAPCNEIELD